MTKNITGIAPVTATSITKKVCIIFFLININMITEYVHDNKSYTIDNDSS